MNTLIRKDKIHSISFKIKKFGKKSVPYTCMSKFVKQCDYRGYKNNASKEALR